VITTSSENRPIWTHRYARCNSRRICGRRRFQANLRRDRLHDGHVKLDRHGEIWLAPRRPNDATDHGHIDADELRRRLGLAMSQGTEPATAAAWPSGLLTCVENRSRREPAHRKKASAAAKTSSAPARTAA
jgi:hypothetical protein